MFSCNLLPITSSPPELEVCLGQLHAKYDIRETPADPPHPETDLVSSEEMEEKTPGAHGLEVPPTETVSKPGLRDPLVVVIEVGRV